MKHNNVNGEDKPYDSTFPFSLPDGSDAPTTQPFILGQVAPLDPNSFPNPPLRGSNSIPHTLLNVEHIFRSYHLIVRYNVITKKVMILIPGYSFTPGNADNVAMAIVNSLLILNQMTTGRLAEFVLAIADKHPINPIADWIHSKPWDGMDRLPAFYATLITPEEYPESLKRVLMYRWLLSAAAAALLPSGFRARGVLTLVGPQSIGKTAWVIALVPDPMLRESAVKLDHHLDGYNKDSILTAISHWIVEIGELDSSFKKGIARLKGFLTSNSDKIRPPYARTYAEYPRKTVFCATVNDNHFLIDSTGNTRWWTIPVTKVNYQHGIDMQQLFAQLAIDFKQGKEWWLTRTEEMELEDYNKAHRVVSAIQERILAAVDLARAKAANLPAMTATEVLIAIGFKNPSNGQSKEAAAVLRELFGDSKRIKGQNKWRVPLRGNRGFHPSPSTAVDDDDEY